MKLFKSTLAIVALFAIGSVGAKALRRTGATTPARPVTTTPVIPTQMPVTPITPVQPVNMDGRIEQKVGMQIVKMNSAANNVIEINKKATAELLNAVDGLLTKKQKITLLDTAAKIQQALIDNTVKIQNILSNAKKDIMLSPAAKVAPLEGSLLSEPVRQISETGSEIKEIKLF